MENRLGKRFVHNLIFAFSAQGTSFLFSALMSLLVPKMLGVEQYAYWQLFIFYSTYVGFFHFGLSDGVYLKNGGIELEKLNNSIIGSQFKIMILWQMAICLIALPFLIKYAQNGERQYVWVLVSIYLVIANATWYLGYVFQAANKTSVYSTAIIISKVSYIAFIVAMVFIKTSNFKPFVLFYVVAQAISFAYVVYNGRSFIFSEMLPLSEVIKETWSNIRIGINLTISNIASSLILGIGRAMVIGTEGISSFGLLSLSISLTNFFLQFIAQVSMVMFPALRHVNDEKARKMFLLMRSGISYLICGIFLVYTPLKLILMEWLPQYEISLSYMIFLLPICVFDGKMQIIYNTYLKVYRKEKCLLLINIISLFISVILCAIGAFLLKNIIVVAIAMTVSIIIRSIIANVYLSIILCVEFDDNLIFEILLTVIFIVSNMKVTTIIAFIIYLISFITYLLIKRNDIRNLSLMARSYIKKY